MVEAASDPRAAQVVAFDDGGVIDALRRGDAGAFARLVAQYHASLRRVARLYITNRAIANDVVQDTWLGVIQGIWAFEGRSSPKTWIFRILINRAKTRAARATLADRSPAGELRRFARLMMRIHNPGLEHGLNDARTPVDA